MITLKELKKSVDLKIKGRVSKPEKCSCGAARKLAEHRAWLEDKISFNKRHEDEMLEDPNIDCDDFITNLYGRSKEDFQMALNNLNKKES